MAKRIVAAHRPVAMCADARLNRERILSLAYKAFADDPDVSLNTIGKLAGVGAGKLYRHFPTRQDLILAVYRQELQSMVDSVHDLVAEYPPLEALRVWFLRLADFARVEHGLGEAFADGRGEERRRRSRYAGHRSRSCTTSGLREGRRGPSRA
jgi:AcrR family transcriptional regulator